MADEEPSPQQAEIITLKANEVPDIPAIDRVKISRKKLSRVNWRNKKFTDLNALDAEFDDCDFRYSVFERAYFRDAKFSNCRFDGARFIDCSFKNANFYKCDLKFALFQRCLIDLEEMIACLPAEPNIRRDSLQNLRANAVSVGDYANQGMLVLQEVEAAKLHYKYALRGYDTYYRKKYSGFFSKLKAGAKLLWLQISGLVWGHGERPRNLILSGLFLLLFLTFINFWSVMPRVGWNQSGNGLYPLEYVIRLFLNFSPDLRYQGFLVVDFLIVILRYLYAGLFISILYRAISHR